MLILLKDKLKEVFYVQVWPGTIKHRSQGKMNFQEKIIGINKRR